MAGKNVKAGGAYVELGVRDKLDGALKKIEAKLSAFGKKATLVGAATSGAGAAIVGPLVGAAKLFAGTGAALDDISKRTGVAGGKLSELSFAAGMSGTSIETVEKGLGKMAKVLYSADEESKNATDSLADLGLNIDELRGLSPDKQFEKIADALSSVRDPSARAALAMQVFGGAGAELLPMFENGSAGLKDMAAQAQALGLVLSDDSVSAAAELDDAFGAFMMTIQGVAVRIGEAIAGPLTWLLTVTSSLVGQVSIWISENKELVSIVAAVGVGLLALGAAITAAGLASTALAIGLGSVGGLLAAITSPIALVVAGVGGLIVALATLTNVFDPVLNYLSEGFAWLSDVFNETWGGISAALETGNLELAGKIAFTGLKLVIIELMNEIAGAFGTSLDEMISALTGFAGSAYQILRDINAATLNNQTIDTALKAAQIGAEVIGRSAVEAVDTSKIRAELDALAGQAKKEAEVEREKSEAAKRTGGGVDPLALAKLDESAAKAEKLAPKSIGGFSAAALNRTRVGKEWEKDTAKNTGKSAEKLSEVVRLLPTLAMRFG